MISTERIFGNEIVSRLQTSNLYVLAGWGASSFESWMVSKKLIVKLGIFVDCGKMKADLPRRCRNPEKSVA